MGAEAAPRGRDGWDWPDRPGARAIERWVQAQAGLEEGIFSFTNDRTGIFTYLSSLSPTFNTISFAPLGAPGGGKMARTVKLSKPSCQPKSRTLVIPGLSLDSVKTKRR